jgi:peroxiredoxin
LLVLSRKLVFAQKVLLIATGCGLAVFVLAVTVTALEPLFRTVPRSRGVTLQVGDPAPDFTLRDTEGREFHLAAELGKGPVVLVFGSLSCPYCAGEHAPLKALIEEYHTRALVVFVYTAENHPPLAPLVSNWEERRQRGKIFKALTKQAAHVLVDEFDAQSVQAQYGSRVPTGFVIGTDGRLLSKQMLTFPSFPSELVEALQKTLPVPQRVRVEAPRKTLPVPQRARAVTDQERAPRS